MDYAAFASNFLVECELFACRYLPEADASVLGSNLAVWLWLFLRAMRQLFNVLSKCNQMVAMKNATALVDPLATARSISKAKFMNQPLIIY